MNRKNTIALVALLAGLFTTTQGCGFAAVQHVARSEQGGAVRLHGPIVSATAGAHVEMTEACGGRWRLLDGQEALAMRASVAEGKSSEIDGASIVEIVDRDRDLTYECVGSGTR